ncbi:MAG: hypothetical protein V1858_01150 [Candidatus Gottesmanbacteria bacterium]
MTEKQQDLGKKSIDIMTQYKGPLLVTIKNLGSFTPDFTFFDKYTLFDYIGHTAAVLGTNMTSRLSIQTSPEDWKITRFDPGEGILEVEQLQGEIIDTPIDDLDKLKRIHRITNKEDIYSAEDF